MRNVYRLFGVLPALLVLNGPARADTNLENPPIKELSPSNFYFSFDAGVPFSSHTETIKKAVESFNLSKNPAAGSFMTSLRAGWGRKGEKFSFGFGTGLQYGSLVYEGGSYGAGTFKLHDTYLYLLASARFGYQFAPGWVGYVGTESYRPIQERVELTAPTGETSDKIDSDLELALHATKYSLQYALNDKIALEANIYLPALRYGSLQGRGSNGLTLGVENAL
jgi:hypothetical protein